MIGTKGTPANMFWKLGNKLFVMLRHAGLIFCGKQGIEKTMELAIAYKTDVSDPHGVIRFSWNRLPKSMSIRGICD